jgi:hypothetical protein
MQAAGHAAKAALHALRQFIGNMSLNYRDIDFSIGAVEQDDSTNLDDNMTALFQAVGLAAQEKKTAVVLFIDEFQVIPTEQMRSLILALHMSAQDGLPITMVAAGLPSIPAQMGAAKTYAERIFQFSEIGMLPPEEAIRALNVPAEDNGASFTAQALDEIIRQTSGYPYFLQEWGSQSWNLAKQSPITLEDVEAATPLALDSLDSSFFRTRLGPMTPIQKAYLYAMASLGKGPYRSGHIAEAMKKDVSQVAMTRGQLIEKGVIYSVGQGFSEFTVPLFDAFLRRTRAWTPGPDLDARPTQEDSDLTEGIARHSG